MKSIEIKGLQLTTEKSIQYDFDRITSAESVFNIMKEIGMTVRSQEYAYIIGLDTSNNVNCIANVGMGRIAGIDIDSKVVFQYLYLSNSTKFILVHNHPSGSLKPSKQDIDATHKLNTMATILEFEMLDHVIVTQDDYTSLKKQQIF